MKLDLKKIDYKKYEKAIFNYDDVQYLEQDIARSYAYLIKTHRVNENEIIVLRILRTRGIDKFSSVEQTITSYEDFRNFVLKTKLNKNATFDIYYHIFNIDRRKMNEFGKEHKDKMKGNSLTVGSTSILEADFDGIELTSGVGMVFI